MEETSMKNKLAILLGATALAIGGASACGAASSASSNATETKFTGSVASLSPLYRNEGIEASDILENFDFAGLIASGIEGGGVGILTAVTTDISKLALNAVLSSMGIDTRSATEKALDKISSQLDEIQSELKQGISDVKRTVVRLSNESIMNALLDKLGSVQTPIAGKMATMIELAKKELDANIDPKEVEEEKLTFYKGLGDMKFANLGGTTLWNQTENLAKSILSPSPSNLSLDLFDLYEEIYGSLETWDYMTVAPRAKFIGYIASLVNSLAQLSKIEASFEVSKLKEGDANRKDYEIGIKGMAEAVNELNAQFKAKLDELASIKKRHDEQHLITHRDRVVDQEGNLFYEAGKTVSSKLFAVTASESERNYLLYSHDGKNEFERYNCGAGVCQKSYYNYVYTLDCSQSKDLYEDIFAEFKTYKEATSSDLTIKDYLYEVGFTCDDKELFDKARGFYSRIDCRFRDGKDASFWTVDRHNDMRAYYYDFEKPEFKETPGEISEAIEYCSGWFSTREYSGKKGDQIDNYYLVFLGADQKTLEGKVVKTKVEGELLGDTSEGAFYSKHYKGYREWSGEENASVTIG